MMDLKKKDKERRTNTMNTESIKVAMKTAAEAEYKDGQLIVRTAEETKAYTVTGQYKEVLDMMNR